jgi:dTDP-4-dehydrorhamnose 3,5-epimerase
MDTESFSIQGPHLLKPRRFGDARGFFSETYSVSELVKAGFDRPFVQDNHSSSAARGTVRGLHYQAPPAAQDKLIRVSRGSILDIAVDIRRHSPTFGKHVAVVLSAENWHQMLIPVGFAHGFCTLEDNTEVQYKVTAPYAPQTEGGIIWNDPALAIAWPEFAGAQLSEKDLKLPTLAGLQSPFD